MGLKLFEIQRDISISEKEKVFLESFIAKTKVSMAIAYQILKSWVAAGLKRDSGFSIDFSIDRTNELLAFYLEKRLLYLSLLQDLVVEGKTDLISQFLENGNIISLILRVLK